MLVNTFQEIVTTVRLDRGISTAATGGNRTRAADELGISVRTVEAHRARVMEKLGARSLSDIVRLALSAR